MNTVICANTDQLRAVARQMRGTADLILSGSGALAREMDSFAATWSGSARDRGMARWETIHPRYQPDAERLTRFAKEIDALADRLDEAARVFGDGTNPIQAAINGIHSVMDWLKGDSPHEKRKEDKPDNLLDLYRIMHKENDDSKKIKVFEVGENNYVITLDGTDPSDKWTGANSLVNGFLGVGGLDSSYTRQLRETLMRLPPGANVNLFGYSQGGIVAHNTVDDSNFMESLNGRGVHIDSVNSVGSPPPLKHVPGITYREFDAPTGDPVTNLAPTVIHDGFNLRFNPESILAIDAFKLPDGIDIHTKTYADENGTGGDLQSKTLQELVGNTDHWQERPDLAVNREGFMETLAGAVTENSPKEVIDAVRNYTSMLADVPINLTVEGIEFTANVTSKGVDETVELVGDGIDMIQGAGSWAGNSMKNLFNL